VEAEEGKDLVELSKRLVPTHALRTEELGAVLASLGPNGDARSRLAAVVALLSGTRGSAEDGGAFAGPTPIVTTAFTSGFHNCLRGSAVNGSQHAIRSA
jgi:hypothetical protein